MKQRRRVRSNPRFSLPPESADPASDFAESPALGCALGAVALLLVAAMFLPALRLVPLKMLPYDNKNEFQIVIDMPEATTLDQTDNVAREMATFLSGVAEVRDVEVFTGRPSPMDFNGMVRHYFLRNQPSQADMRVNLAPKEKRQQQSHEIVLRLRDRLTEIGRALGSRGQSRGSPARTAGAGHDHC